MSLLALDLGWISRSDGCMVAWISTAARGAQSCRSLEPPCTSSWPRRASTACRRPAGTFSCPLPRIEGGCEGECRRVGGEGGQQPRIDAILPRHWAVRPLPGRGRPADQDRGAPRDHRIPGADLSEDGSDPASLRRGHRRQSRRRRGRGRRCGRGHGRLARKPPGPHRHPHPFRNPPGPRGAGRVRPVRQGLPGECARSGSRPRSRTWKRASTSLPRPSGSPDSSPR